MKFVVLFVCLVAHCWYLSSSLPFTQKELDRLAEINFHELPHRLQVILRKSKKIDTTKDASHFCCATDQSYAVGVHSVSKTSTKTVIVGTKVGLGSHSCGFLGLGSCGHGESIQYSEKLVTYIEHVLVPDTADCPDRRVICCNKFIMISHQCYELDLVMQNVDFFKIVANGTLGSGIFG